MSTIPGLLRAAARRTSPTTAPTAWARRALMQGLADGYFILPGHGRQLPRRRERWGPSTTRTPAFKPTADEVEERINKLLSINGYRIGRTPSTASSATSCGTSAAWPATSRA